MKILKLLIFVGLTIMNNHLSKAMEQEIRDQEKCTEIEKAVVPIAQGNLTPDEKIYNQFLIEQKFQTMKNGAKDSCRLTPPLLFCMRTYTMDEKLAEYSKFSN